MNTDGTVDTILVNTPEDTVTRDVSSDVASAGDPKSIRINGSGTAPPSGKKYFIANAKLVLANPGESVPNLFVNSLTPTDTEDLGSSVSANITGELRTAERGTTTLSISTNNVDFEEIASVGFNDPTLSVDVRGKTFRYLRITNPSGGTFSGRFENILLFNTFSWNVYDANSADSDTGNTRASGTAELGNTEQTFELYDVPSGKYLSVRLAGTFSNDQTAQITELTVVETEA